MPSYHFDLGDSNKGPIGFCARVIAESPEAAVKILQDNVPDELYETYRDGDAGIEYVNIYLNLNNVTVNDIDDVEELTDERDDEYDIDETDDDSESVPVGWDSVETGCPVEFTFAQVRFFADMILAGAFDRIESMLPPNIPLSQFGHFRTGIQSAIEQVKDTAAMTVAIFLAQTTGEGFGAYDWEGADVFDEMVKALIEDRTRPAYKGYEPGKPCSPDCSHVARMIAEQWHNAKTAR